MRKRANNKIKVKSYAIGILVALIVFIIFGVINVLIKNKFFIRMTPVHWYDYLFLTLTAVLSGAYTGLWYYNKKSNKSISDKCNYAAAGGVVGGLFSFGCAICNKLLIFLLGLSGVMTYFMPLQPILGIASISVLGYAVYIQSKNLFKSPDKIKSSTHNEAVSEN